MLVISSFCALLDHQGCATFLPRVEVELQQIRGGDASPCTARKAYPEDKGASELRVAALRGPGAAALSPRSKARRSCPR